MNGPRLFLIAAVTLTSLPAGAVPGDLDASFGIGGKVVTPIGSGDDRGQAMAMQSDGKLVVAGYSHNGSDNDFAVVRYNVDGSLDTNFNGTGKATTDFGGSNDIAHGVALQGDGRIIAVGGSLTGGSQVFALARYNTDGTLDTSFGVAGTGRIKTTIGQTNASTQARSVKVQADGKILVAGYAFPGGYDFALLRYNSDGTLDNGFGVGGLVTTDAGSYEFGQAIALQSDGKIIAGGSYNGLQFMATRYESNGTLDSSFGTSGKVFVNGIGGGGNYCYQVAVQGDDKVVLAGSVGNIGALDFRLVRLTANGTLDTTFGTDGLVDTGVGTADDVAYDLAVQSDGRLVTAGYANTDFAVVRYNHNGSLDTSFQSTGKVMTSFSGGSAVGTAVVIGSDDRIAVAGYAHDGTSNNFALAQYFGSGSLGTSTPAHGSHTGNSQPVISGTATAGFTVNVHVDDSVIGTTVADGTGAWSFTPPSTLADGVHTAAATETDGFGNTGPLSNTVTFTVDTVAPAAPEIIRPEEGTLIDNSWPVVSGTAEVGATVTIYLDDTAAGTAIASSNGGWSFTPVTALADGMHMVKATATDRAGNTGLFSSTMSFSTTAPLFGGPGTLDASFGTGGKVVTPIGSGDDRGQAMAMQSDGKLVVAGCSHNGSDNDFAVVRYNVDGSLDTTFNATGRATTDFGGSNDIAHGVALQGDGKIIAAGGSLTGGSQVFALARYNTDGTLDTSFGPTGTGRIKTTTGQSNASTQARSVKVQADGKILVAGYAFPNGYDFALLRYNSDGTLDNGFGVGGLVTTDAGSYEFGQAIALQSDGKIIVGGSYNGLQFMATRYETNGTLDSSFGTSGKVFVNGIGGGGNYCYQVAVQGDDKVVLAGSVGNIGALDFRLVRLTANGTLDTTFGTDGLVDTGVGTADDVAYDLAVQNDGKLVAAGYAYNANTDFTDFALVRYSSDGSLDTSFQSTGKVTTSFSGGSSIGSGMVIASDGRIAVAGYAHDGTSNNFALARYFGTIQPPIVTTGDATGIVRNGAVLNGTVNPNSLATTTYFEYGTTTNYGGTSNSLVLGNGYLAMSADQTIGGLTDNTLYHYRLVATNAAGTTFGEDRTFTTAPNPPLAFTGDASNVSASGATLVGVVIPNGRITTTYFEYGLTTAYGAQTDSQMIPAEGTVEDVFAPLTGLIAGATYHFRLVAINSGSPIPITGEDKTFQALPSLPVVTLGSAAPLTTTSVTLSGLVNANDASTQVFFDYGTDGVSFPNSIAGTPATLSGTTATPVSASLLGLSQGVTYHYRLRAVNAGGESLTSVASFTLDLLSGLTQTFPNAPPDAEGFLFVNLAPGGLLHGWRFVGEQQWRASGVPVGGLTTGDRDIEFRPVPGYIHPPAETVGVVSGEAALVLTRDYYVTATSGSGGLSVTLKPDALADAGVPQATRAQWRLLGEDDNQWRDSGATLTGLISGSYLIECKPFAGRATPVPGNVIVSSGQTSAPTITYFLPDATTGTPPAVLAFETVTTDPTKPYAYVGQLRSNAGSSTGFVVKQRVVATAAHVVWDDGTLTSVQGLQWSLQRHRGTYEPKPIRPRGFYLFDGYAAQRAIDNSPGDSSPQSQTLDVAAIYFNEDAGRGGHGGFLASDLAQNEFLLSNANKMLVGYPVDGIATTSQGRMHATSPMNVSFTAAFGRTFTTPDIRSFGGNSGGPLCVQFEGGAYYPAAIYLGGTNQTVVRAIDSDVVDLFNRAEVSGNGGGNNTGGGVTHTSVSTYGSASNPGALKILIEPAAAVSAGGGWRLAPESGYRPSGAQKVGLNPGNYVLQLTTVAGYPAPDPQSVTVTGGQLTTLTYTYGAAPTPQEAWRQTYFGTTANSGDAADDYDYDRDGFTNAEEFAAGTDPTQAGDYFKMDGMTHAGGTFSVTTSGKAGRAYVLQRSTSMAPGSWMTVDTVGPLGSDGPVSLTDAAPPNDGAFYRIQVTGP